MVDSRPCCMTARCARVMRQKCADFTLPRGANQPQSRPTHCLGTSFCRSGRTSVVLSFTARRAS
jgi:hypothetical protein